MLMVVSIFMCKLTVTCDILIIFFYQFGKNKYKERCFPMFLIKYSLKKGQFRPINIQCKTFAFSFYTNDSGRSFFCRQRVRICLLILCMQFSPWVFFRFAQKSVYLVVYCLPLVVSDLFLVYYCFQHVVLNYISCNITALTCLH